MDQGTENSTPRGPEKAAIPEDTARYLLASIADSSDDVIVSKDLNGIITSWNEAARAVFGYTAEEIVGQPILRLVPEELYPEEFEILKKLKAEERIHHYETVRVRKNGEKFPISVTISPNRGTKKRSALMHTRVAGEVVVHAVKAASDKVAGALREINVMDKRG